MSGIRFSIRRRHRRAIATLATLAPWLISACLASTTPMLSTPMVSTPAVSTPLLPAHEAFTLSVASEPGRVSVRWTARPGYHVYRSSIGLSVADPDIHVGAPAIAVRQSPSGAVMLDARFPYCGIGSGPASPVPIVVKAQGCHLASPSVCYMPQRRHLHVTLPKHAC